MKNEKAHENIRLHQEWTLGSAPKPNLLWVKNLWEVGTPIKNAAQDLANHLADAESDFQRAELVYAAQLDAARARAEALESSLLRWWTPRQINAAKRGETLL